MELSVSNISRKYEVNYRIMNNSEKKDKQNDQEKHMQKALDDVIKILDRHCEQGELDKEVRDKLTEEMKRIFHDNIEEKE